MLKWRAALALFTAITATALCALFSGMPDSWLSQAELAARDRLSRHGQKTAPDPKLIFLAIDSESVGLDANADLKQLFGISDPNTPEGQALLLMSQHWPWPRSVYALVLDRLMEAGAKVVAFDLLFPTESEHDGAFRAALEKHRDRVVVGSNFTAQAADRNGGGVTTVLTLPSETLIPQSGGGEDPRVGFVNFWPDADGVIRSTKFHANFGEFLAEAADIRESHYSSLAAQIARKAGHAGKVPADTAPRAFRYTAPPQSGFHARSIFEIFVPEYWARNFQSGALFKDAIVVIGASGNWQHDEHQTSLGMMSGPEIQLNVLNATLRGEFLSSLPPVAYWGVWVFTAGLAGFISVWCHRPARRIALLLAAAAVWASLQLSLFNAGWLAPVIGPVLVFVTVALVGLVFDLIIEGAEQLRLRVALIERKRAQELLEAANAQLEQRVSERTVELTKANSVLTGLLAEKDVLLKEIHHRVKNNLQVISSLLNLQSNLIEDPGMRQVFAESRHRVRSMALIHEKLYQSDDLSRIDFEDYIRSLTSSLQTSFGGRSAVRIAVDVEAIKLSVDSAVPCGLIVNELVTNCFKYAFTDGRAGEIRIGLKRSEPARLSLTVSDNGVGFPKGVDFRNTESLGMQIVTTLADQLDGTISLQNGAGTTFEIKFPDNTPAHP